MGLVRRFGSSAPSVSATALAAFVAVVAAMTVANNSGVIGIHAIAASPQQIESGRLWLLVTSGLLVQKPFALSLASFAALGALTLMFCGYRVLAWAAVLGHVCSILIAYGSLAVIRVASPDLFAGLWSAPDYGVSAISAAWLGAIAGVAWRRRGRTLAGKASVVISCLAIAAFAWMLRHHVNVLDSEHGFAFVIGVVLSWRLVQARAHVLWNVLQHRRARQLAVAFAGTLIALAGASFADALRSLERPHLPAGRIEAIAGTPADSLGDSHIHTSQGSRQTKAPHSTLLSSSRNSSFDPASHVHRRVDLTLLGGRFECSVLTPPSRQVANEGGRNRRLDSTGGHSHRPRRCTLRHRRRADQQQ